MYEEFSALDKSDVTEAPAILSFAMGQDFVALGDDCECLSRPPTGPFNPVGNCPWN